MFFIFGGAQPTRTSVPLRPGPAPYRGTTPFGTFLETQALVQCVPRADFPVRVEAPPALPDLYPRV